MLQGEAMRPANRVRLDLIALCACYALGTCALIAQPVWVAAVIRSKMLSVLGVGWLASGQLFLIAFANIAVARWGQRINSRLLVVVTALCISLANLVAMRAGVLTLLLGLLVGGLASGALLACVTGIALRTPHAQRTVALMQVSFAILTSTLYFFSPTLVLTMGPAGIFVIFAIAGLLCAAAGYLGLAGYGSLARPASRILLGWKAAPWLGSIAVILKGVGVFSLWTYIILIGNHLGFDNHAMARVLAGIGPCSLLGAVSSHALGERWGLLRPLFLSSVAAALVLVLLVNAPTALLLALYGAVLFMAGGFWMPYAVALLGRIDPTGRFAAATPAFAMIGTAFGPALGARLSVGGSFQLLAMVASGSVLVAALLFWIASAVSAKNLEHGKI